MALLTDDGGCPWEEGKEAGFAGFATLQPFERSSGWFDLSSNLRKSEEARAATQLTTTCYLDGDMLHQALKMIRAFHDISQKELSERLGIAPSYLSEIESNKKQPTIQLLEKYSQEFKIPVSSIMFFSEAMKDGSISERTRVNVSRKVLAMLNFIAERSGRVEA